MRKALLFEDEESCRTVMIDILKEYDIEVDAYPDPTIYFKKSDKCPNVDVILTDHQMPNMTGLDFLKRIDEMRCDIPPDNKAVISGGLTDNDITKIEELGIKCFHKPCSIDEIYDWLNEIGVIPKH